MNLFDRLVGYFSPVSGLKRSYAREQIKKRKFEGASRSRRTKNWRTSGASADLENQSSLKELRNRARDLIRNNPYAAKGVSVITSNLVGTGINPHLEDPRISDLWQQWAGTTAIDYDGQLNLAGMQRVVTKALVSDGEILIRKRITSDPVFPLKIQILEADFLPVERVGLTPAEKNRIVQGIEVNAQNKRVAYHLYENHPGAVAEKITKLGNVNTFRIMAEEIGHIYRLDRPGQMRGPSWFAPVMIMLRDLDEFQDAEIMRQKIAALYAGFIKDTEGGLEEGDDDNCELLPGTIQELPPGMDIVFSNPPRPDNYPEYISTVLHAIATGLGITYESLTSDLKEVNFSSARMGWLEMDRNIKSWRSDIINPKFNNFVFNWFVDTLPAIGMQNSGVNRMPEWIAPRREMIDPTKEVPAKIKEIRAGLTSFSEAIMELGHRPELHFDKLSKDNETIDKFGLVLDADPRKVDGSGKLTSGSESNASTQSSDSNGGDEA